MSGVKQPADFPHFFRISVNGKDIKGIGEKVEWYVAGFSPNGRGQENAGWGTIILFRDM